MEYICCSDQHIPIESNYIDILFTLNAMDHTKYFDKMGSEVLRILKQGGLIIRSFNLYEMPTKCEPQIFTQKQS